MVPPLQQQPAKMEVEVEVQLCVHDWQVLAMVAQAQKVPVEQMPLATKVVAEDVRPPARLALMILAAMAQKVPTL